MKPQFIIISKAIPYFILEGWEFLEIILLLSFFLLDLPIKGSIILLFFVSTIFIITNLFIGILISIFQNSTISYAFFDDGNHACLHLC